jgi:hypothetical protein
VPRSSGATRAPIFRDVGPLLPGGRWAICASRKLAEDTTQNAGSFGCLVEFGADWKFHLEGRALAHGRLDPDTAAVHLDDLFGDRKPAAGASFRLRQGAVNLVEWLEDARDAVRRVSPDRCQ